MASLKFLRTFVAVAQYGSFAEAAHAVALTPAAVSFQMRMLEAQLGRPLFERRGRKATLTAAGRQAFPEVVALLDRYDRLCVPPVGDDMLAGVSRFGAIVSGMGALSKGVALLKRRHPGLEVHLFTGKAHDLVEQVTRELLDGAIVVRPERLPSTLAWLPLALEPYALLMPAAWHARTAADALLQHPFLRFDRGEVTGRQVDRLLRQMACPVNEFLELNSLDTLIELVRQEVGVTLAPIPHGAKWQSDSALRLLPLPSAMPRTVRRIGLVTRADHSAFPLTAALHATCLEVFAQGAGETQAAVAPWEDWPSVCGMSG